jgi:hypothetical protein
VEPFSPFTRRRIARNGGVNKISPAQPQALQPFRREINHSELPLWPKARHNQFLVTQFLDVENVVGRRGRDIVKYRFHHGARQCVRTIQGRDDRAVGAVNGTESGITSAACVELARSIRTRVHSPNCTHAKGHQSGNISGWRPRATTPPPPNHG